jgi:hypothetical protein
MLNAMQMKKGDRCPIIHAYFRGGVCRGTCSGCGSILFAEAVGSEVVVDVP